MNYSVAEAKNNLPKLIDRALAGEEVKITRRGVVVATLNPSKSDQRRGLRLPADWFENHQIKPLKGALNSDQIMEMLRREDDEKYL